MTTTVIITFCILLLLSYFFDLTSKFTKIPSVILLLATGMFLNPLSGLFVSNLPDLSPLLPILGTVGLVLIVLEGTLELEFDKSKMILVKKSFLIALIPLLLIPIGFSLYIYWEWQLPFRDGLINFITVSVISSAIAIPSAINLSKKNREFITYESSFSDILGVLFFNFATYGSAITMMSVFVFTGQVLLMVLISVVASLFLALMLAKIDHPIKYGPIIIFLILIYQIAKIYHLPSLIFILFFGLILGNIDELQHLRIFRKIRFSRLNREVYHFKEVVKEATFIVRSMFFMLFGFLIKTSEIVDVDSLVWSVSIVAASLLIRYFILRFYHDEVGSLLFVAPRGLITILLFLSVSKEFSIPFFNSAVVVQVILISTLLMMAGLFFDKSPKGQIDS